jgi:hypothetical protein
MLSSKRGFNWMVAVATDAAATYPAASGANHSTTTAGSSVTAASTRVIIHSISVISPVAANTLLVQNHGGTVTYFTVSAAAAASLDLDISLESGFRVIGGTTGTATVMITYSPIS